MSAPQRMRAWGAAVSSGHLVLGALGWLVLGVPPLFFGLCAAVTLALALAAAPLLRPPPRDDPGGGEPGDETPPPPWWPEFEREFHAYAELQRRVRA